MKSSETNSKPDFFITSDESDFREKVVELLSKGAHTLRNMDQRAYVDLCRVIWREADDQVDSVFTVRFLVDKHIEPSLKRRFQYIPWSREARKKIQEPTNTELGDIYCSVWGFADLDTGDYFGAPSGYTPPPSNPRVHRVTLPFVKDPDVDLLDQDSTISQDYAMALLDILGFKAMLTRLGLEGTSQIYQRLIQIALGPAKAEWTPARGGIFWLPVRHAHFSDSLLLWVPLRPRFVTPFVDRCIEVFCEALSLGVPLRGVIGFGRAILDPSSSNFLGAPLVRLFEAEKQQEWTGLYILPPSPGTSDRVYLEADRVILAPVPTKATNSGSEVEARVNPVPDWPRRWRESMGSSANIHLRELRTDGYEKYYDNAIAFVERSDAHADSLDVSSPAAVPTNGENPLFADGARMQQLGSILKQGVKALEPFAFPSRSNKAGDHPLSSTAREDTLSRVGLLRDACSELAATFAIRPKGSAEEPARIDPSVSTLLVEFVETLSRTETPSPGELPERLVVLARRCLAAFGIDTSTHFGDEASERL